MPPSVPLYDDEFRGYRLFIGNISPGVNEHDVSKYFGRFGEVKMVWLARDPPGFAYVVYFDRDVTEMAKRKTHMSRWFNRLIKVEFAVPRGRSVKRVTNRSGGDRRSRSRELDRFRSRGVRINRSRSPAGRGRLLLDDARTANNGSRGTFPSPPRRMRFGNSNNDMNDDRHSYQRRVDNNNGNEHGSKTFVDRRFATNNNNNDRTREPTRRNIDHTNNSVNARRDNNERDYVKTTSGRSRYRASGDNNETFKRARSQTPNDHEQIGEEIVEENKQEAKRHNSTSATDDPKRRQRAVDIEEKALRVVVKNRSIKELKNIVVERSPGELDDDDDNTDAVDRASLGATALNKNMQQGAVSQATTRYRSSPDDADADDQNNNVIADDTRGSHNKDNARKRHQHRPGGGVENGDRRFVVQTKRSRSPQIKFLAPQRTVAEQYRGGSASADERPRSQNTDYEELDDEDEPKSRALVKKNELVLENGRRNVVTASQNGKKSQFTGKQRSRSRSGSKGYERPDLLSSVERSRERGGRVERDTRKRLA